MRFSAPHILFLERSFEHAINHLPRRINKQAQQDIMLAKTTLLLLSSLVGSSSAFTLSSRVLTGRLLGSTKSAPLRHSDWRLYGVPEEDEMDSEETRAEHEMASLNLSKTIYTASIKSPKDSYVAFAEKGAANAKMAKRKIFHQSVLGGCYVGFGALLSLSVAGTLLAVFYWKCASMLLITAHRTY